MAKKVSEALKSGDRFSLVGTKDGVTRNYTCVGRTTATILSGGTPVQIQNVTALNESTGRNAVFALSELVDNATVI